MKAGMRRAKVLAAARRAARPARPAVPSPREPAPGTTPPSAVPARPGALSRCRNGRRTCMPMASPSTSTRTALPLAGRDYMSQQVNFAASDPPFRNGTDPFNVGGAEHPSVGYSYVPDTAGGTAFMYHLTSAGHLITNLRLSGETIMKIFTGQITNWDNPADHQGLRRPAAEHPDHPGHPLGRLWRDVLLYPLDGARLPGAVGRLLPEGQQRPGEAAVRADRVLPIGLGCGGPAERLQQRGVVHRRELRAGCHRLRRVCLCAQLALSGGQSAECGGLLRPSDRIERGGGADPGRDQREFQQPRLPPAEPG